MINLLAGGLYCKDKKDGRKLIHLVHLYSGFVYACMLCVSACSFVSIFVSSSPIVSNACLHPYFVQQCNPKSSA